MKETSFLDTLTL